MVKWSAFASIYLLAFIMYCNLFGGIVSCFAKITRVVFSGQHDFLRSFCTWAYPETREMA